MSLRIIQFVLDYVKQKTLLKDKELVELTKDS
jgi:hypothetical protein